MRIEKIKTLPVFKRAVKSISQELGNGFEKHCSITNLTRHVPKHERKLAKEVVKAFIKSGFLRKHRTNTFSWTARGIEYAKTIIQTKE